MRKLWLVFTVVTLLWSVAGCSTPPSQVPGTGPTDPEQAGAPASAIQDWSMEGGVTVQPMRMDRVMAEVDDKLVMARSSRLGSGYRSRGKSVPPDKTGAPYFHVAAADTTTESLPLKSTSARVNIAGVIAQVLVTQVYQNRGSQPIEAVYVFPGSTRAAVHGMRMTIGQRVIVARIDERDKARAAYEAAKEEGKRASLLEQERPNVFTMNVANIMPGDVIKTELLYSELLVPDEGVYNFIYPTVVGPRNPMGSDPKTVGWNENPYLGEGQPEPYSFDIQVHLESPIGLKEVVSPSHPVKVAYASKTAADVTLGQPGGGNRDYVLRYRLSGGQIESGTMVYDHGGEKFFLMMMEPPARVQQQQIPPREYVFVLDVSGSMRRFPLDTAKELMRNLLGRMRPTDHFNVVLFAGRAGVLNPQSLPATPDNIQQSLAQIMKLRGGGGTNLMDALRTSYGLPRPMDRAMSRSVVVVTDGYVTVEAQAFRFIRKNLGDANLFAFGIGSSVNRALIEGMARAGMGSPFVVLDKSQAPEQAEKLRQYIEAPVLTDIKVSFEGLDVYDVVPKALPDLMARRPLILFGKLRGQAPGAINVVGSHGMGQFQNRMVVDPAAAAPVNRPLRALWARKWVEQLMDQYNALGGDESIKQAVTNLGLGYSLLTQFTSFVAIDSEVVNRGGQGKTVRQPLPLPKGVPDTALPGNAKRYRAMGAMAPSSPAMPAPAAAEEADASYAQPSGQGYAPPPAAEPPRPTPRPHRTEDDRAGGDGTVDIKLTNVSGQHAAQLRRLIEQLLVPCARQAGFKGKLTLRLHADGRIGMVGASPALTKCLERQRAVHKLATSLPAGLQADRGKAAIVVITIR